MIGLAVRGVGLLARVLWKTPGTILKTGALAGAGTAAAYVEQQVRGENALTNGWGAAVKNTTAAALDTAGFEETAETVRKGPQEAIDSGLAGLVYNNVVSRLGVEREEFDKWWETIDPTQLGKTVAWMKGIDLALDTVGLDIVSTKQVLMAAVAWHFLVDKGYAAKGLGWLSNQIPEMKQYIPEFLTENQEPKSPQRQQFTGAADPNAQDGAGIVTPDDAAEPEPAPISRAPAPAGPTTEPA